MSVELKAPTPFDPKNWGERVSIETIARTRIPTQGPDSWRPVPHETFVEMIEEGFSRHGFEISEPVHYRGKSRGNKKIPDLPEFGRFLSLYGLRHPGLADLDGITWEAGFGNSLDMTVALGGGLGRRVSVCSNGEYMGSTSGFKRKHTKGIDEESTGHFETIYSLVDLAIGGILRQAENEEKRILRWQNTECSDDDARYVAVEAAKAGVVGAAGALRVLEHWKKPEHPEFADRNLWSLNNAFTSEDRGSNLFTQGDRFQRLDGIMNARFGFAPVISVDDGERIGDSPNTERESVLPPEFHAGVDAPESRLRVFSADF